MEEEKEGQLKMSDKELTFEKGIAALQRRADMDNEKLSTEEGRFLHKWALGMIIEGREPVSCYLAIASMVEWTTWLDNVCLNQREELTLERSKSAKLLEALKSCEHRAKDGPFGSTSSYYKKLINKAISQYEKDSPNPQD